MSAWLHFYYPSLNSPLRPLLLFLFLFSFLFSKLKNQFFHLLFLLSAQNINYPVPNSLVTCHKCINFSRAPLA